MLLGLPPLEVAGWGGIYSHQPKCSHWRWLLAMGAPDSSVRHRTVSGAPPRHPVIRAWSWSTVGGFALMWHRTVRCPSDQLLRLLPRSLFCTVHCQSRPLRADSRCSVGAPDTVRWHTGQSGAPDQGTLRFPFCSFLLKPNLFFLLVCVEPLTPVECII